MRGSKSSQVYEIKEAEKEEKKGRAINYTGRHHLPLKKVITKESKLKQLTEEK